MRRLLQQVPNCAAQTVSWIKPTRSILHNFLNLAQFVNAGSTAVYGFGDFAERTAMLKESTFGDFC